MVNGIALAVGWGKLSERVKQLESHLQNNDELEKDVVADINHIKTEVQKHTMSMYGVDGQNGVRGTIKELKESVSDVSTDVSELKTRFTAVEFRLEDIRVWLAEEREYRKRKHGE